MENHVQHDHRLVGWLSLAQLISWGSVFYTFALLMAPLERELGLSRAQSSLAFSLALLMEGLMAYPVGRWIDRGHERVVMTASSLLAGICLLLHSQVSGIAGSPGVVEGVARVVMSEAEFDSLMEGEILVCQMTNPAWQVLYGKISAVVTDAGGSVSHPAVLAREYEIPAVVGTSVATSTIKTGDRLRVNGTTGLVEIL